MTLHIPDKLTQLSLLLSSLISATPDDLQKVSELIRIHHLWVLPWPQTSLQGLRNKGSCLLLCLLPSGTVDRLLSLFIVNPSDQVLASWGSPEGIPGTTDPRDWKPNNQRLRALSVSPFNRLANGTQVVSRRETQWLTVIQRTSHSYEGQYQGDSHRYNRHQSQPNLH